MSNNALMSCNIHKAQGFNQAKYRKLIEELRNLRKEITKTISHEYVMPQSEPCIWLDIQLICGECSITLRVDPRNLFVRGYSTNKDSEFWEFSDSSLINGSKSLPYSGSLLNDGGLCSAASEGFYFPPACTPGYFLKYIRVGYIHLRRAIVCLVTHEPFLNPSQSARCLLCIIEMMTEAARIAELAAYVVNNLWSPRTITLKMQSIQTALSMGTFSSSRQFYVTQYSTSRMDETLMSIDYVLVKDIYGPNKICKIYGTVKVLDAGANIMDTVYDRSLDNTESKGPGEYLSLCGSSTILIDACDPRLIDVYLRDDDGEIAKGEIYFDGIGGPPSYPFDKHLEQYVLGEHGKVGVGYSVMGRAFGATINVVMINNHDMESSANVYGSITASYHLKNSESSTTLMLFDKSTNERVPVSLQQSIPLTRPVFPIPVKSDLTIVVDLWDHDSLSHIVCGCVKFIPAIGTQLRNIIGEYGQVQVSITCGNQITHFDHKHNRG